MSANPASSSSSSSVATNSAGKSIAEWILEWKDMRENDRDHSVMVNSIHDFFAGKDTEPLVKQLSKEHSISIMVDLLCGKFRTSELANRASRLAAIRATLVDLLEQPVDDEEEQEEENTNAVEEDNIELERVQISEVPSTRSGRDEAFHTPVSSPTRIRRNRKAKTIAEDRHVAMSLSDRDVINGFSRRVGKLKSLSKKEVSAPKLKLKSKKVVSSRSSTRPHTPDSSDDDSDPSDSDSNRDSNSDSSASSSSGSLSSDSDSESSSDSDIGIPRSSKPKRNKKSSNRKKIRHMKRKRGSRLAEYMWSKSHGHVKRSLTKFDYKSKRNQYEVLLLASVFDSLMKMNCVTLYDKPIRLIASRITALQSYELTGSWDVADQLGEDSVHNGLVSRKQLNRAAKSAENIKKVMSKASSISGGKGAGGVARDSNRPRVPPMLRNNNSNNNQEQGSYANRGNGPVHS